MTTLKNFWVSWLGITCLMGAGQTNAANPNMESMTRNCAGCHGSDGQGFGKIPPIRGLDRHHFIQAMQGFLNGARPATVMNRIAGGFSDAELVEMADIFWKKR